MRHLRTTFGLRRQLHRAKKDAEFAREMAMLPLSLKNPDLGGQELEIPAEGELLKCSVSVIWLAVLFFVLRTKSLICYSLCSDCAAKGQKVTRKGPFCTRARIRLFGEYRPTSH